MTWAKTICIITVCLISARTTGQTGKDLKAYRNLFGNGKEEKASYSYALENRNEIGLFFSGLFLGYKWLISSQDGVSCTFTPSCSEYGMLAIKKYGVLKGIPMTFDRLTRCHGFNAGEYTPDEHSHLKTDFP